MNIDIVSVQANAITELRRRVAAAEQETKDWQVRQQSLASLFNALQTSHDQLQGDYRRLSQAHQEMLLAHGSLLREHRAVATNTLGLRSSASALARQYQPASGDSGIEFTDEMECNRLGCPTTPPHRHITPPATPKSPGGGVPPCPVRINDIQAPPSPTTTSARFQATLDDDFGDPDVNPTKANPNHFKNGREVPPGALPASMEPPASNTSEKGGAQGNPTKTLQQLRDSARIASKFADASGESGPTVTDPEFDELLTDLDQMRRERTTDYGYSTGVLGHPQVIEANEREIKELRQGIDVVSDCGFQAQDGSDETRNTPDKSTEDR